MIIFNEQPNPQIDITEIDKLIAEKKTKAQNKSSEIPTPDFKKYSRLYSNATEDIDSYYKEFNNFNSFLTPCGSSDQIFNAILYDAKKIVTFDINSLCRYILTLKYNALKALNRSENINFFIDFDYKSFDKIAPLLDEYSLKVWEHIFSKYSISDIKNYLFFHQPLNKSMIIKINPYLKGRNYTLVKEKLEDTEITFLNCDLYELPRYLKEQTFDAATLSNIYEYLNFGFDTSQKNAQIFVNFLLKEIFSRLSKNGVLIASYLYSYDNSLKRFIENHLKKDSHIMEKVTYHINNPKYQELLRKGLTWQNLSYTYLLEILEKLPKEYNFSTVSLPNNIEFGQSPIATDFILKLKK